MFDQYQASEASKAPEAPEIFEIGRASELISGSVKVAPPPDQSTSSNLSFGGDLDESDE